MSAGSARHAVAGPGQGPAIAVCVALGVGWLVTGAVWLAGSILSTTGGDVGLIDVLSAWLAGDSPATLWADVAGWQLWPLAALAVTLPAAGAVAVWRRQTAQSTGTAPLTGKPARQRADRLRGGLDRRPPAGDLGVMLGRDGRRRVYASWEDTIVAVMPPRAGKTVALAAPAVMDAPGPVIATSNKRDLFDATADTRRQHGPVWRFDPQQIVDSDQWIWWDPLAVITSRGAATRMASHFAASTSGGSDDGFWTKAAEDLVAALLLAAAYGGRDLGAVSQWLADPTTPEPGRLLDASGWAGEAEALRGYQTAADRTRDSVFQTARTMTRALKDPDIMRWVTPPEGEAMPALSPGDVVDQAGTVYLLSRDGPDSAAPLVAALADQLLQHAISAATGEVSGRLDPPLVAVLDEAANIVPLSDLPNLYSHLGSRGIVPVGILQSWPQGERVWGREGMRALWGASTVKLVGAGLDDAQLLGDVSRLAGEQPVEQVGWQRGAQHHSTSGSTTWRPALPVDEIRALPDGHALLLAAATGRPTRIRLEPYWQRR